MWITKKKRGKFFKRWDYQTTLQASCKNVYAGQEATLRTWNNKLVPNWERSMSRLFIDTLIHLYTEYMMANAKLVEAQARIKIARRNINKLRSEDEPTLMAERKEELKSFLMKVKEESEKAGLKLSIQKTRTMASNTITSRQVDGKRMETVTNFIFLGSKIMADGCCSHEIKRYLFLGRKTMISLKSILKSRHIANKVSYSQSYGFSSSCV